MINVCEQKINLNNENTHIDSLVVIVVGIVVKIIVSIMVEIYGWNYGRNCC